MRFFYREIGICTLLTFAIGCSTSNGLKKFDEGDLAKEISADAAKRFEVHDIPVDGGPAQASAPVVKTVEKKKKPKKSKKVKAEVAPVEPSSTPTAFEVRRQDPLPFEVGENLEYGIRYIGVTAGYLSLEVMPFKQLQDRKVFRLQARATTAKFFELIYRVNDVVESFWDYDGLFSHKFTMDLDESKQTRKLIELYDYDKKKSFFWNRINHVEKGLSEKKESYDIPLWSQDPVSSLYYLRTAKLPTDTETAFKFPVILDGKPWEGVIHFVKKQKIYAGGKDREADVYHMENFQDGQLKNKDNTIWISTDEHRYILRVEAKVKVGTFAVALDKII